MAILETNVKRFIGDSHERKPRPGDTMPDGYVLTTNDMPAGSSFLEEDTAFVSRWDTIRWSTPVPEGPTQDTILLASILTELRDARLERQTGLPIPVLSGQLSSDWLG